MSYKDLYEMYHENKDVMDKSVFFFQSSVVDMENIGDLFTADVRDALPHSEGVTVHWYVNHDVYIVCSSVIGDLFTADVRDALPHSEGVTVHWYVNHDVYCLSVCLSWGTSCL